MVYKWSSKIKQLVIIYVFEKSDLCFIFLICSILFFFFFFSLYSLPPLPKASESNNLLKMLLVFGSDAFQSCGIFRLLERSKHLLKPFYITTVLHFYTNMKLSPFSTPALITTTACIPHSLEGPRYIPYNEHIYISQQVITSIFKFSHLLFSLKSKLKRMFS